MDIEQQTIQIILEILLILIGLYLAFFKSYFNEKGKNVATKEDITGITKMIEIVKNQIYYNTQSKLNLKTEERNALVNFYEKYNYWLNSSLDTSFSGINEDNNERLKSIESQINEAKFSYELAEGRMQLFVRNKTISKIQGEIKTPTLNLQHLVQRKILEMESSFIDIRHMRASTPLEKQSERYTQLLEKRTTLIKEFHDELLEKYKEILPLDIALKDAIHSHLQSLLEGEENQSTKI